MILMFVIESSTRALVSVLESVEHICRGRRCFIVMKEMGETPLDFDGKGTSCGMAHRCIGATPKPSLCPPPSLHPSLVRGMNLMCMRACGVRVSFGRRLLSVLCLNIPSLQLYYH